MVTDPLWTVFPPPIDKDVAAHSKSDGILPFSPGQVESLHLELCHVKDTRGRDIRRCVGKPAKEVAWHVSSLDPDSRSAEKFAEIVRTHWCVEAYHGKRDNGYHEDAFTRRCDVNVMAAMMVARSFGMWICARHPEMTTAQARSDLKLHPAKLVRIMMKGDLQ